MNHLLRQIPAIHELQQDKRFSQLLEGMSKQRATECLQEAVAELRDQLVNSQIDDQQLHITDEIFSILSERLSEHSLQRLQTVINGTGTVLHTNLGRARLSEKAMQNVRDVAINYSNLEYDLQKGKRGSRHDVIEGVLKAVTGAEAAMVVNNNAAAVYFILKSLAKDREVIVSRGELVEIGGSFRVSSIMAESGAKLVEVGTTNKTHRKDYDEAITEQTAMIMKVHTSNFKVIGFTQEVPPNELKQISEDRGLIFYEDLGSGALYDFRQDGIGAEPTIAAALKHADLVSFSGDKLLGGPQVGLIAGKKQLIDMLKKTSLPVY